MSIRGLPRAPLARLIAQLVGHAGGSQVTEAVYVKQIRPVLLGGAEAMDRIFTPPDRRA